MRKRTSFDCLALSLVLSMLVALLWSPPVAALAGAAGAVAVRTPPPRPTVKAPLPTRTPVAVPTPKAPLPATPILTPVPAYQGAEMIDAFATTYLGLDVVVGRTYAAGANLKLPAPMQAEVDVAVAVAGQAAAGAITAGAAKGMAEVALGEGTVSGDVAVDLSAASLGAYTLAVRGSATDSGAALALIRATYPALGSVDLQPATEAGVPGYLFRAPTLQPALDAGSRQATAAVEEIVAGAFAQGQNAVVWVVIGNGTLAGAVGE